MVLVELGHETAVRPHDCSFGPDCGERLERRHLAGSDKVGDHYGRTPANAHDTVDQYAIVPALRECAANEGGGSREVLQNVLVLVVGYRYM